MTEFSIGRYEVEGELGSGGMATVYLARDPYIKRQVAIKVLSDRLAVDEQFLASFKREAQHIAALAHPSIVPIFDFGEHEGQPYIVMQYLRGGTLSKRIAQKPMKLRHAALVIERVAKGLDAAHEQGIIHRDVKPQNILFNINEEAFLADFGLAKPLHTSTGTTGKFLIGTPAYMSPEQASGMPVDARSDIYSLGIVLYQMLTRQLPYNYDTAIATAIAHVNDPIPDIQLVNRKLPASCNDIIQKVMAKNPDDRYHQATTFAQELTELASGRWYLRKLAD